MTPSSLSTVTFWQLSAQDRHSNRQCDVAIAQNARYLNHVKLEEGSMKTTLPEQPDVKSPAGAEVRFLMEGETGTKIHCTLPPHQINRAIVHATVSEFWYVLEGHGEIWREDGPESCVTMPPWPGESEATYLKGKWQPTI
jgi:mannose-6-phosphate isomerase-like protein (cupin superfamily)